MKEILKQVIYEQKTYVYQDDVERKIDKKLLTCREIIVISGIRRCGKSVLLQQLRNQLQEKDYFINFDDERLINFSVNDFQILHEVFIELFGEQHTFYFDEIQNIVGWERFVRRLYDAGNKIFVTGSNARMLSRELGTHLTGRYIGIELYPFSFVEFLQLKKINLKASDFYTTSGRGNIINNFEKYLTTGGFPQYIENQDESYLSSLYQSIIYRDVLTRHSLSGEKEMLEMIYYLASNTSKRFTYNSLASAVGIKHPETVKNYISFVEDTYLITQVMRFDYSVKKQMSNAKKSYFIDSALIKKIGFNATSNRGQLLENTVFLELKRRGYSVYYYSGKHECDFIIREDNIINAAIQVSLTLKDETTKKREIAGLTEAMNEYSLNQGTILTLDEEETITIDNNSSISILPIWKWLLEEATVSK